MSALGPPVATENISEQSLRDTYDYVDGGGWNSRPGKALRLVVYTVGDIATIFLTQLLWMPLEVAFRGPRYSAIVDYRRDAGGRDWLAENVRELEARD
jgi:hypothetical protein